MILIEHPFNGNKMLIRTYSDNSNKALLQIETNAIYDEAIDVYPSRFTYVEIDKIEDDTRYKPTLLRRY